ncbi:MAG: hypothetical protein Q4C87_12130 [Actinomycetaceae bacterium]|nr:hypothetical protein [Actinomycetaceae bacterium]
MTLIVHPYFGFLDTDSLTDTEQIWLSSKKVNGNEIQVHLWAEPGIELTEEKLDTAAEVFEDVASYDRAAREYLSAYLDDHPDEWKNAQAELEAIGVSLEEEFLSQMELDSASIWYEAPYGDDEEGEEQGSEEQNDDDEEGDTLLMYYTIASQAPDYVIGVAAAVVPNEPIRFCAVDLGISEDD